MYIILRRPTITSTSTYKPLALDFTEVLSFRIDSHWFLVTQLTKPWLHHFLLVLGHPTHKTSATLPTQTTHRSVLLATSIRSLATHCPANIDDNTQAIQLVYLNF